jgi:hypothetical protein
VATVCGNGEEVGKWVWVNGAVAAGWETTQDSILGYSQAVPDRTGVFSLTLSLAKLGTWSAAEVLNAGFYQTGDVVLLGLEGGFPLMFAEGFCGDGADGDGV